MPDEVRDVRLILPAKRYNLQVIPLLIVENIKTLITDKSQ